MSTRRRVVVFGGAGFVGSHLCERLCADGYEVLCFDNLLTGSTENLRGLETTPWFHLTKADVSAPLSVEGRVDAVLHFASPASPDDYRRFPVETLRVGSLGTFNALELARAKQARLVFASTSEVYGDPEVHPQPESYWGRVNPVGARACYDEAKRFSEAAVSVYGERLGVDTAIVRIFNTYGPRMRCQDGRVIPNFICQSLLAEPITVAGQGSQTRSFCYVDDLVEGVVRVMESTVRGPMNLGNPQERTILELARLIKSMTASTAPISFVGLPPDDPKVRCPDISMADETIGWRPKIGLEEGLRKTITWFTESLFHGIGGVDSDAEIIESLA